jgi:hypothetical protein
MRLTELLLMLLVGWTLLGLLGLTVSFVRKERQRVTRGLRWLIGIWATYLLVVVGVSLLQKQRVVAIGQQQCFDEMCFTVTGADELPGYLIRDGQRLIRVSVQVTNKGHKAEAEQSILAYLVDSQGRRWRPSSGVGGVALTDRVAPQGSITSEPVFKVAADAKGLGLVFTHGRWQPSVLVIGDSDSLLHKRTVVDLSR